MVIPQQRVFRLGSRQVVTPTLWLGHDLDHQVRVWKQLTDCPGLMLNAYQILTMPLIRMRAIQIGLSSLLDFSGPIFMDSGGFLFQRDGKSKVTALEILDLYKQLKPDVAAILDVPLYPLASSQSNYRRWSSTLRNTALMYERNTNVKLAPILHAYNLPALKRRHAQLQGITRQPAVVCIGSLVPLLKASYIGSTFVDRNKPSNPMRQRWSFIARLILTVRQNYPNSILHVFGVGSLSTMYLLILLGVDSVDSISWRLKAAYGEIQLPGLGNRRLVSAYSTSRTRRILNGQEMRLLEECRCPVCCNQGTSNRIKDLARSFENRATHNAHVFIAEMEQMRTAVKEGNLVHFIQERLHTSPLFREVLQSVILPEIGNLAG